MSSVSAPTPEEDAPRLPAVPVRSDAPEGRPGSTGGPLEEVGEPVAYFGSLSEGWLATGLEEVSSHPSVLDSGGRWAVVITFEGDVSLARFRSWQRADASMLGGNGWAGIPPDAWQSSMDRAGYIEGVETIRRSIARGDVYQVNLCRVLSASMPVIERAGGGAAEHGWDIVSLGAALLAGNPAPHSSILRFPGVQIACASPELYLQRADGVVTSRPIKGTAVTADGLSEKDVAENVMIVDLVRNDLSPVARVGTVRTPDLLRVESHPGLVHLVSTVAAELRVDATWPQILDASFPPGSVSGAPKSSALRIIGEIEPRPRGPYCGAIGMLDADRQTAELAVGIRSFWVEGNPEPRLCFGTGAGITWGSDAESEWRETELKARHLLSVASREVPSGGSRS